MAVCSWCLCCGKVSTLITRKVHFLTISHQRTAFTSQHRHLPLLNQVAMPFYLTHQQVVTTPPCNYRDFLLLLFIPGSRSGSVRRSLGALPQHLSKHLDPLYHCHFPSFLCHHQARPNQVSESQIKGLVSYADILYEDIVSRYLFGLPPPRDSMMPGKACRGFVPCFILAAITVLLWSSLNIYRAYAY